MKGTWIAAGVLTAAGLLAIPVETRADHPDAFRIGYDRGYQDGASHGAGDGHHGDYNFWHDHRYRRGDAGYRFWYGPRRAYVAGYRQGYEQGYRQAFAGWGHGHHGGHQHEGQEGDCYEDHDDGSYDWDRRGDRGDDGDRRGGDWNRGGRPRRRW